VEVYVFCKLYEHVTIINDLLTYLLVIVLYIYICDLFHRTQHRKLTITTIMLSCVQLSIDIKIAIVDRT